MICEQDEIIRLKTLQYGRNELDVSKPCLKRSLKKKTKLIFKTDHSLMQVKRIAECSKGSILQYFRPLFGYHLSLLKSFVFSGRLRHVLLLQFDFRTG